MKDQCPECGGLGTVTIAVDTGTFGTGYFRDEICDWCDGEGEVECDFCVGPLVDGECADCTEPLTETQGRSIQSEESGMSQAKVTQAPWEKYANDLAEFYGPEAQAKRFRQEAERYDLLADAASLDGDSQDAAACRAKATEARRKARRCEANARSA